MLQRILVFDFSRIVPSYHQPSSLFTMMRDNINAKMLIIEYAHGLLARIFYRAVIPISVIYV